ncbi:MAG: pirin family protein [Vulcanimicrobiaceae bacterium]
MRREIVRKILGTATSDGAGVRLTRVIGTPQLPDLDPFLLLDEFGSDDSVDYAGGFPDHPHRGFETVTYMLEGRMRHRDNHGNSGLLESGSVQWMTAGRGIVHSEMPEQENGAMRGFQLWVNLPARDKMSPPRYQDVPPERIPEVAAGEGARVRVIAGALNGAEGPVTGISVEPIYLDVALDAGASFRAAVPRGHQAFAYVYEGSLNDVARGELAVLGDGDTFETAASREGSRFILVAGRPLGEPVARYGPFVMNTRSEVLQAVEDFQAGRF